MAMGREGEVQGDLMVTWAEMPRSPGRRQRTGHAVIVVTPETD